MEEKELSTQHNVFVETLQDEQAISPQIVSCAKLDYPEQNTPSGVLCKGKEKIVYPEEKLGRIIDGKLHTLYRTIYRNNPDGSTYVRTEFILDEQGV